MPASTRGPGCSCCYIREQPIAVNQPVVMLQRPPGRFVELLREQAADLVMPSTTFDELLDR
jgi:hypothetical protein